MSKPLVTEISTIQLTLRDVDKITEGVSDSVQIRAKASRFLCGEDPIDKYTTDQSPQANSNA